MKNLAFLNSVTRFKIFLLVICFVTGAKAVKQHTLSFDELFNSTNTQMKGFAPTYTFTCGLNADGINYVQLCYGTESCASCNAPFSTIKYNYGTPIPYHVPINIRSSAILKYLKNIAGVTKAGDYYIGMYVQSTNLNCNTSSAYCGTNIDGGLKPVCMKATLNGTTITSLTQIDSGIVNLNNPTLQFAYVASQGGSVSRCTLNESGIFNTCAATPSSGAPTWNPNGLAFATVNESQYSYVAASAQGSVWKCNLDSNGNFSGCGTTPVSQPAGWAPNQVAFATSNESVPVQFATSNESVAQFAYVTSTGTTPGVYYCPVNSNGTLGGCNLTPTTNPFSFPTGIAFAFVESSVPGVATQYAYVVDGVLSVVFRCGIQNKGGFVNSGSGSCVQMSLPAGASAPFGVSFTFVNGKQYAYIGTGSGNRVYYCSLNSNGTFGTCNIATSSLIQPRTVTFSLINGTQYAYVGTIVGSNAVYKCPINLNGTFGTCNNLGAFTSPFQIATAYYRNGLFLSSKVNKTRNKKQ